MKTCRICKQEKELSEFNIGLRYKDKHENWCKKCKYERAQAPKIKENQRMLARLWYQKNKDEYNANTRAKYVKKERKPKTPKEVIDQHAKEWRESHKEHLSKYNKEHYRKEGIREIKNKQKLESVKRRSSDPSFLKKLHAWSSVTAEKRRGGGVSDYTFKDWLALCEKYNNRCLCCGKETKLTIDHVIPLSKGGKNVLANIQPLCMPCNHTKWTRTIDYRIGWGE